MPRGGSAWSGPSRRYGRRFFLAVVTERLCAAVCPDNRADLLMRVALSRTVLPVRAAPFRIRNARQPQPAVFRIMRRPACRIGMRRQAALRVISPLLAAAVRINNLLYLAIFGVTVLPFLVIHFPVNQVAFAVIAVCRRGAVVPVSRYLPERIPLPFRLRPSASVSLRMRPA